MSKKEEKSLVPVKKNTLPVPVKKGELKTPINIEISYASKKAIEVLEKLGGKIKLTKK